MGAFLALSSIVFGWATAVAGLPLPVALILGLGAGAGAGLVNGVGDNARPVCPPFIATLAMLSVARGLALVISGGQPLKPDTTGCKGLWAAVTLFGIIPLPVILLGLYVGAYDHNPAEHLPGTLHVRHRRQRGGDQTLGHKTSFGRSCSCTPSPVYLRLFAGLLLTARLASAQPQAGFYVRVGRYRGGRDRGREPRGRGGLGVGDAGRGR